MKRFFSLLPLECWKATFWGSSLSFACLFQLQNAEEITKWSNTIGDVTPIAPPDHRLYDNPLVEGVRLGLPEFTWVISCSIVNVLWLFRSCKGRRLSMAIKNFFQHARHIL